MPCHVEPMACGADALTHSEKQQACRSVHAHSVCWRRAAPASNQTPAAQQPIKTRQVRGLVAEALLPEVGSHGHARCGTLE